ncbi:MAG: hypothetical protein WD512_00895, partial [Candidatus Paceibacterota bacterium]
STPFVQNLNQDSNHTYNHNSNPNSQIPQTCPYCKSTKHIPFLNDGGSVLICQNCQKTFSNIYYNTGSPWFSDKFKTENGKDKGNLLADKKFLSEPAAEIQFSPRKKVSNVPNVPNLTNVSNLPNLPNALNANSFSNAGRSSYDNNYKNNRPAQGMRGEGNYSSESNIPKNPMQNNYADHANNQLQSYRAKFDFDHHSSRV